MKSRMNAGIVNKIWQSIVTLEQVVHLAMQRNHCNYIAVDNTVVPKMKLLLLYVLFLSKCFCDGFSPIKKKI